MGDAIRFGDDLLWRRAWGDAMADQRELSRSAATSLKSRVAVQFPQRRRMSSKNKTAGMDDRRLWRIRKD